ncbi:hypothetical protein BOX15_Mlig017100g2 [Macrostomum lignano]|uniref:Frizzled-4 n=1 Tax=Macrostomum lignano TaxID=282301 RepID=A0A267G0M2_9PLAT|nr:hypothetical protein BOX15_Mlig017100g2 [Macrostomum lignano]
MNSHVGNLTLLLFFTALLKSAALSTSAVVSLTGDEAASMSSRADQFCAPVPIRVPVCSKIRYNTTASFIAQDRVAFLLGNLQELVNTNCAPYLRLLACSVHLPLCNSDQSLLVRPCREFCSSVKGLCEAQLRRYGIEWPSHLNCDQLELEDNGSKKNLCLRPIEEEFNAQMMKKQPPPPHLPLPPPLSPQIVGASAGSGNGSGTVDSAATSTAPGSAVPDADWSSDAPKCSAAELPVGGVGGWCAKRCLSSYLFAKEDRDFADAWMLAWSVAAAACAILALVTFALEPGRFRYPERPVVWVAACHLVHAGAHLLRAALGPELACSRSSAALSGSRGELALVSRHAGQWCAAIFLLLYFSWLAGLLWWLALALCWHLSAARRWHHGLLAERTVWLHLLAWGAPLLLSVTLLVLHRIEGDELTHLCVVDGSRPADLLMFQVGNFADGHRTAARPRLLASALRSALLSAAAADSPFPADERRQDQRQADKSAGGGGAALSGSAEGASPEQRAARLSLFAFLFALPAACVLAANVYELAERRAGLKASQPCWPGPARSRQGVNSIAGCRLSSRPSAAVYMLKIFMSLTAGLPAGLLVWANWQSLSAWRAWLGRLTSRWTRRKQLPQTAQPQPPPPTRPLVPPPPQQPQPPLPPPPPVSHRQQRHYHVFNPAHSCSSSQQQYELHHAYATVDSVRCDSARSKRLHGCAVSDV